MKFSGLVKDILDHPEFRQLDNFPHHRPFSILDHSIHVAYLTFRWSTRLKRTLHIDVRSATRAALLHDFYLYDWHVPRPDGTRWHGFRHPAIACRNAKRCFALNEKEQNIILSHMWPLTHRWPGSREAWLVTLADKTVTMHEFRMKLSDLLARKRPQPK